MSRYARINLALLAFIIAVALFLVLTTRDDTARSPVRVTGISGGGISRISIRREGKENIDFIRDGGTWRMTSPRQAGVNSSRIDAMLDVLQARSYAQLHAGEYDLQRFDLKEPAAVLMLDGHTIYFGGTNPLEDRRYIMYEDTIHLINDGLFHQLQQPPEFFINSDSNSGG